LKDQIPAGGIYEENAKKIKPLAIVMQNHQLLFELKKFINQRSAKSKKVLFE